MSLEDGIYAIEAKQNKNKLTFLKMNNFYLFILTETTLRVVFHSFVSKAVRKKILFLCLSSTSIFVRQTNILTPSVHTQQEHNVCADDDERRVYF